MVTIELQIIDLCERYEDIKYAISSEESKLDRLLKQVNTSSLDLEFYNDIMKQFDKKFPQVKIAMEL